MANTTSPSSTANIQVTPPVVAVLGHVDHGKTTLLDAIRNTTIAAREHGGITQKIGASSVTIMHEGKPHRITFIDTPGHEAFGQMRSRGAQAADIVLLIVSAVDGVQPQTRESIGLILASKLPFIVVLTKSDVPDRNVEKVKQQLLKENVTLEGYGGDVPVIEVSARTNTNIKELLDLILLVMEMHGSQKVSSTLKGIIIESRQDKRTGATASLVVKSGKLSLRDDIECEGIKARVRTLIDTTGKQVQSASAGEAVEILGFESVPPIGGIVTRKGEALEQKIVEAAVPQEGLEAVPFSPFAVDEEDSLSIVLTADTLGSLEAIQAALPKKVKVRLAKTGEISTADVLFAKSVGAIVLGFNMSLRPDIQKLAQNEKVLIRTYTIIYEMLDEIKDVLEGKRLALIEEIYGKAKIIATFPYEKKTVLGISVLEGRVARNDRVRLMRGDEVIGESSISSLRQGKDTISKVEAPDEAGIILGSSLDFTIGDMLLFHA